MIFSELIPKTSTKKHFYKSVFCIIFHFCKSEIMASVGVPSAVVALRPFLVGSMWVLCAFFEIIATY